LLDGSTCLIGIFVESCRSSSFRSSREVGSLVVLIFRLVDPPFAESKINLSSSDWWTATVLPRVLMG